MSCPEFYLRYYSGHSGTWGHEFLEFELKPNCVFRYANYSTYKRERMIRREFYVTEHVLLELRRLVRDSGALAYSNVKFPESRSTGQLELDLIDDEVDVMFRCAKLDSLDSYLKKIEGHPDAEGIRRFQQLMKNIQVFAIKLVRVHYNENPFRAEEALEDE